MKDYSDIINMPRPVSAHPKMDVGNRAKQFMPMDALRGFSLAILTKQVEQGLAARITLSEDAQEQLDRKLHMVQPGDKVTVTFFQLEKAIGGLEVGTFVTETGVVECINTEESALILSCTYIPISEIVRIDSSTFNGEYADQEVCQYADADPEETVR